MELHNRWQQVLVRLSNDIRPQDVAIWFKDAKPVRYDGEELTLKLPNSFYSDWIGENYMGFVECRGGEVFGTPFSVSLTHQDDATSETSLLGHTPSESIPKVSRPSSIAERGLGVNLAQTFESFVVGKCNEFAHAAALGVTEEEPARRHNPLYIYGNTGLGKTHLMHAIGNRILAEDPRARVCYVTAEDFMNEMINAIRYKRMDDFRSKYRLSASVLLIDDIQFLSGKERTQEEFFHTFNALMSAGSRVILTSDVPPAEIRSLEPRLRTRFVGGLIADVQAPDLETLLAILAKKCEAAGFHPTKELGDAIAHAVQRNVRELEGVVHRLVALRQFYDEPLTLDFARRHMPSIFAQEPPTLSAMQIIQATAKFYNLTVAQLTGKRRLQALVIPRHVAMYLCRTHLTLSFPEIGKEFGDRDHTTIQHAYKKIKKALATDADLLTQVRLIENSLGITS